MGNALQPAKAVVRYMHKTICQQSPWVVRSIRISSKAAKRPNSCCMQREVLKYLHDIKESIDSIYSYLGDKRDFNSYRSSKLLRRGIERESEVIGEATSRILKIDNTVEIKS